MTSTSTPRAGLSRLLNSLAVLALLLVVAGGATAQSGRTIFVDANGGDDANNGTSATVNAGVNGPVASIQRAIELARLDASGNTISIEAGFYDAEVAIQNAAGSTALDNLIFMARPDQDGNTEVNLIPDRDANEDGADNDGDGDGDDDDLFLTAVQGFTFTSQGGARFIFTDEGADGDDGALDFQAGTVNFGTGIVTIDGVSLVERTNALVSGTVQYDDLPDTIRFNGDASTSAGTLLPGTIDASEDDVLIDIALGSVAATVNDAARTFSLGTDGLTLGDDGAQVTLRVRDGNTVSGTITTIDGSGGNDDNGVVIEGEGSIGDLVVNGAFTEYDLDEVDAADGGDADSAIDRDNSAASITVRAGELQFADVDDDLDGDADDDADRYLVTGDFRLTGGTVTTEGDAEEVILVVQGDFRRTDNTAGNFAQLNVYLEGTDDADFAPGTNLTINALHINATPEVAAGTPANEKMVLFLQDITVNSGATGTNDDDNIIPFIVTNDAEVDLNGNLVNVTNGGQSIVNGTVSDSGNSGAVRFTGGGIVSGGLGQTAEGVYSSILVSGPDVTATGNFDFTGAVLLLDGGINVADGADISPRGDDASVVVNIAAQLGDPTIEGDNDGVGTNGMFNADNVEYDLTYQDNEAQDIDTFEAGNEFDTDFIRNLTVDVTDSVVIAEEDEAGDGTISGDLIVRNGQEVDGATSATNPEEFGVLQLEGIDMTVLGTVTVENYARIALGDDDDDTTTPDAEASLTVTGANTVQGEIVSTDDDDAANGVVILSNDSSIDGAGGIQSLLENVRVADNADATITDIRRIIGSITDVDGAAGIGSSLTLGLRAEPASAADRGVSSAGNVLGDAILNASDLTLSTTVEFFNDVNVGGVLALGANDLVFNANEDVVDGDDDGNDLTLENNVTATTGAIQFVDNDGTDGDDDPDFFAGNAIVPNLGVFTDTDLRENVRVSGVFRLYADLEDAEGPNLPGTPANEDIALTLLDGATIALGDDGMLDDGIAANGDELIIAGSFNFRDEQSGTLGEDAFELFTNAGLDSLIIAPATSFNFLGFQANNEEDEVTSLPEVGENAPSYVPAAAVGTDGDLRQQTFTVNALTVANGSFNLAGHNIAVRGDVTFLTDRPLLNAQDEDDNLNGDEDEEVDELTDLDADGPNDDGDDDNDDDDTTPGDDPDNITVDLRSSDENPFSELRFIGASDAMLTLNANYFVGDGIDIVIAKAGDMATVTLEGGALLFDDAFDNFGDADDEFNEDTFDDEYLVLESGILVAGDIADPSGAYVRLDHENRIFETNPIGGAQVLVGATSDQGQGFIFDETDESLLDPQFPDSYINGNVRKRIISIQSDTPGDRRNPGNVIYPVGDMDGDYAEYVLDFESIAQNQNFGLTSINVAFAAESPGGTLGLPIDTNGDGDTEVDDYGQFYWLVTASPRLGANTFFSVQARYDGFELGDNLTIDELRLIRRQSGDASANEYTLVDGAYDNFLLEEGARTGEPVVVAQNVEALLGRQGTIFTYGVDAADRPTDGEDGPTDLPTVLALKGSAPNPFRGRTTLAFDLPQSSEVSVAVFDVMGRQVMNLDAGTMAPGANQTIEIDGSGLASGVYVYRLTAVGADNQPATLAGQITLAR